MPIAEAEKRFNFDPLPADNERMDWLSIAFAVFAAWVTLTVLANERRRLAAVQAAAAAALSTVPAETPLPSPAGH